MTILADFLLATGAICAAIYCLILSRRLRRFTDLEKGVGGAVALLSAQVDEMNATLETAQKTARDSVRTLSETGARADAAAKKLEIMLAALHDVPDAPQADAVPVFFRTPSAADGVRQ